MDSLAADLAGLLEDRNDVKYANVEDNRTPTRIIVEFDGNRNVSICPKGAAALWNAYGAVVEEGRALRAMSDSTATDDLSFRVRLRFPPERCYE